MRIKRAVLLTFLLMLYIVPSLFTLSSMPLPIPAQQNTGKEFSPSTEYETSTQSITEIEETIPDDVLYYPDAIESGVIVASAGQGDWADSLTINDVTWAAHDDREYANFSISNYAIESITYNFLACGYTGEGYLTLWNSTDWIVLETFANNGTDQIEVWYNDTLTSDLTSYVIDDSVLQFSIIGDGGFGFATVDYAQILVSYMTLADSDHFVDSFTDVSEWINGNGVGEPITDGDVLSWEIAGDGNSKNFYSNEVSQLFEGLYAEFNIWTNHTTPSQVNGLLYGYPEDDKGGTGEALTNRFYLSTTPQTIKVRISSDTVFESLMWYIRAQTGGAGATVFLDYLRVGPSDEMGWQHDGSTTEGTNVNGAVVLSSDSDSINASIPTGYNSWYYQVDSTTTHTKVNLDYYPFLEVKFTSDSIDSGLFALYAYTDEIGSILVQTDTYITKETYCWNVKSVTNYDIRRWYFYVFAGKSYAIDYIKAYSIANFTVTQSGTSLDDVLYCDSGTLYCSGTSFTSFVLDHDPALNIETEIGDMWTTTTTGAEIDLYIDASWLGYTSDTSGTFDTGVTLTDFRIKFTDNADIEAITFLLRIPEWVEVGTAILRFEILYDETGLNFLLIFLGLCMIPASTLYLVKGGKDGLSMNKVYYFVIAFMIGWALVIGGIYA